MLKANSIQGRSVFERVMPSKLIKKFILNLPFNRIVNGTLNLNLFGETHRFVGENSGHHGELTIVQPLRAYWLIKSQGELGFVQAYHEGVIDTNSLYQLLYVGYENRQVFAGLLDHKSFATFKLWKHRKQHNSVGNSRKNISYHYDLGNDFYALWLDHTMSYSSAMFTDQTDTLEEAQDYKYQQLLDQLDMSKQPHILEIGCGWGGLMDKALSQGAQVTGLTLSAEQKKYADGRLREKFSPKDFQIKLQDYRHETQQYDHIVSIEMFEAVGKEYWQNYFEQLNRCLKPGGKAALQVITINDEAAENYQNSVDFIQAYIFPGGLLPSVAQLKSLAAEYGFNMPHLQEFGEDYAVTCQLWKKAFNRKSDQLLNMGYDESFQRIWNYYLDYCTVGFETGHISVHQLVLQKATDKVTDNKDNLAGELS